MSFETNIQNLAIRIASEFKALRTLLNGNQADLSALTTTNKTNLVLAINEVNDKPSGGSNVTAMVDLTDVDIQSPVEQDVLIYKPGIGKWINANSDDLWDYKGAAQNAQNASQPLDDTLTELSGLITTPYGINFLQLDDQDALFAKGGFANVARSGDASDLTGLAGMFQEVNAHLTFISGLAATQYGMRALEFTSDADFMDYWGLHPVAKSGDANDLTGLATVATSGEAADLTGLHAVATSGDASTLTGILPAASLPPLGINETYVVASEAEMLALTAERGDMAIRTDTNKTYVLATDSPSTLGDWKLITASGEVTSVNGRTGNVVVTKTDVGLGNVDDVQQQPLNANLTSIAGQASTANKMLYATGANTWALTDLTAFARTLLDDGDAATARGTLSVYSQAEIGDVNADFVATFNAGLV